MQKLTLILFGMMAMTVYAHDRFYHCFICSTAKHGDKCQDDDLYSRRFDNEIADHCPPRQRFCYVKLDPITLNIERGCTPRSSRACPRTRYYTCTKLKMSNIKSPAPPTLTERLEYLINNFLQRQGQGRPLNLPIHPDVGFNKLPQDEVVFEAVESV